MIPRGGGLWLGTDDSGRRLAARRVGGDIELTATAPPTGAYGSEPRPDEEKLPDDGEIDELGTATPAERDAKLLRLRRRLRVGAGDSTQQQFGVLKDYQTYIDQFYAPRG